MPFYFQVFGDEEVIFGYKGLKINIYYSVGSLKQYVKVQHSETVGLKGGRGGFQPK